MWEPLFFKEDQFIKLILRPGEDEWLILNGRCSDASNDALNDALNDDNVLTSNGTTTSALNASSNDDNSSTLHSNDINSTHTSNDINSTHALNATSIKYYQHFIFILRQLVLKFIGLLLSSSSPPLPPSSPSLPPSSSDGNDLINNSLILPLKWTTISHILHMIKYTFIPSIHNINMYIINIINIITERISCEWKSLNKFRLLIINHQHDDKFIQLYYLKVYATINTGLQLLTLINHIIKPNNTHTKKINTHNVQSNSTEVTTTVGLPLAVEASSNYLSLKSNATPGDRGEIPETIYGSRGELNREADGRNVTSSGLPAADLREAEGQLNREAPCNGRRADGRTTSGGTASGMTSDALVDMYNNDGNMISDDVDMMDDDSNMSLITYDLMKCIFTSLCSAVCWPHCKCISESLRLIRLFNNLTHKIQNLNQQYITLQINIILFLVKQINQKRYAHNT